MAKSTRMRGITVHKVGALLIAAMVLIGCANREQVEIRTFRDPGVELGKGTVMVVAADDKLQDTLEFDQFRQPLQGHLQQLGYTSTDSPDAAYLAVLSYKAEQIESQGSGPRTYIGTSIGGGSSSVGVGGAISFGGSKKKLEFLRVVKITLKHNSEFSSPVDKNGPAGKHILEITATSRGACADIALVYKQMLDAIFADVQRASGSVETVKIPADSGC